MLVHPSKQATSVRCNVFVNSLRRRITRHRDGRWSLHRIDCVSKEWSARPRRISADAWPAANVIGLPSAQAVYNLRSRIRARRQRTEDAPAPNSSRWSASHGSRLGEPAANRARSRSSASRQRLATALESERYRLLLPAQRAGEVAGLRHRLRNGSGMTRRGQGLMERASQLRARACHRARRGRDKRRAHGPARAPRCPGAARWQGPARDATWPRRTARPRSAGWPRTRAASAGR